MAIDGLLGLLRVRQWYKNLLIFLGLVFSFNLTNFDLYPPFITGYVLLCLVSGANYAINDIVDRDKDASHPEKKNRPLPSGRASLNEAYGLIAVLLVVSFVGGYYLNTKFAILLGLLFLTSQFYNLVARKVVVLDLIVISSNYIWRALTGIALLKGIPHPPVSLWFIFGVFFVALLLAAGKRRGEHAFLGDRAGEFRGTLQSYSPAMLDNLINVFSAITILFYTMYCVNAPIGDSRLMVTIPVVVFIIGRYLYIVYNKNQNVMDSSRLLDDRPLLLGVALWIFTVMILLYTPLYASVFP
ncbi:UbiA family prenyltransferase [Candidatus Bathyarchaeota archaeon]|nr:UbiA family prenyltransferase [Candidatus Bathyarchaeota archaeon]MBL7078778.1 UbiA family prenyltransferase [Candidatus Bathyarchaeota archaeon]